MPVNKVLRTNLVDNLPVGISKVPFRSMIPLPNRGWKSRHSSLNCKAKHP